MNSVVLKLGLTRAYPERSQLRIMQEEYGFILAHLIAVGWREEAELVARLGFQAGEETFMVSFPNHRIPWLMLKLTHDWLGAKVEPNGRLRPEDGLGPWQKLFDNWRSEDDVMFAAAFDGAADYHVKQSHQHVEEGHIERPDEGPYRDLRFEIEDPNYWIFPVELLAVLRLREWIDLSNPLMTHPLFTVSPLGKLPGEMPRTSTPLFDAVEKKFREMFPATPSLVDLPALRQEQGTA